MTDADDPIRPDAVVPAAGDDPGVDLASLLGGAAADDAGGGGFDMGALFEQASQLQQQMEAAQQEAAETVVEGVAGGGAVKVRVTGGMDFQSVEIDPGAIDPTDPEMLQDLVLAALHDAMSQVREVQESMLGPGGVDLGGLLGGS
jgi:DNA-binding YbaB/EbfC family protein